MADAAGEVQGDRPGFSYRAKFSACQSTAILRVPMQRPPEIDDDSVDPAVAAQDDVQDPSHVLTGAAANAFAEDRGEYLCRRQLAA